MSADRETVFVIDDDQSCRESTAALIAASGYVCETFTSAEAFLEAHKTLPRGCLVTDVRLSGISGLQLQEELNRREWSLPVIIVSGIIDVEDTVRAIRLGAETVLQKPCREQDLYEAINAALTRDIERRVDARHRRLLLSRLASLTEGEQLVLAAVMEGLPNKAIASRLDVSVRTVEDRRRRIMRKLSVTSLAALIQTVLRAGWKYPSS